MKRFKTIDCWISAGLIISSLVINIIEKPSDLLSSSVLNSYFVIGSWQVISMIVHVVTGTFTYFPGIRPLYHWITLIALITFPIGSFWVLAFTAPFMAIFYTWLCFREVYVKMKRPLAILK